MSTSLLVLAKLQKRIDSLEDDIRKLQANTKDKISDIGFTVFTNNYLNLNINKSKSVRIKTLQNNSTSQYYQLKIRFYNYVEQEISFGLFCNNIQVSTDTQTYSQGFNEISLSGTYYNSTSEKLLVDLHVNPKNNKQITIKITTLTIWGNSQETSKEYQACETTNDYFLTYISNDELYYKIFNKLSSSNDSDFKLFENAISHDTCQINGTIYIFRVDETGNLFYSTYPDFEEVFLAQNVSNVSCCSDDEKLIFCYITNNICHYGEIFNKTVISNKILNTQIPDIANCQVFYGNNKYFLVLTTSKDKNYLIETIAQSASSNENISASVKLTIEIQGEE